MSAAVGKEVSAILSELTDVGMGAAVREGSICDPERVDRRGYGCCCREGCI